MRFSLLMTAGVLAASIGLSACSGGGSAVPSGSQSVSSMAKSGGPHLTVVGNVKNTGTCPSGFILCVTISKASPATVELCISYTTGTCPYPGVWAWATQGQKVNGAPYKKLASSASPNPGNPTYISISEKKKIKKSHGKYKYQVAISACNSSSQCLSGAIGVATQ